MWVELLDNRCGLSLTIPLRVGLASKGGTINGWGYWQWVGPTVDHALEVGLTNKVGASLTTSHQHRTTSDRWS